MPNDNTQPKVEATQKEEKAGTQPTTTPEVENKKEEKTYSQKEFDDNMANTRRAVEKETKKKLLAQFGLTLDEEDKLQDYKNAYEASKTDEQKRDEEFQKVQAENVQLAYDLEEKDYTIKALIELTGKKEEDVEDIVKMSKGLKTEDNTIEDCIKKVISMLKPQVDTNQLNGADKTNVPVSQPLTQPSTTINVSTQDNPFKAGPTFNMTKQGEIIKQDIELAKRLASEAGVKLRL